MKPLFLCELLGVDETDRSVKIHSVFGRESDLSVNGLKGIIKLR